MDMISRVAFLEKHFETERVTFAGLQETRLQIDGRVDGQTFYMMSAAADAKGVGGVQIWIRREMVARPLCIIHAS